MSELIISVSGLRGVVGETLTPAVAVRYINAVTSHLPAGPIIVGRDGRATGPMLVRAITSALMACGRNVIDADVAATPTIGVLVRHESAAGAVMISASHNPPPYNGIKMFGPDGRVLGAAAGAAIGDDYRAGKSNDVTHESVGSIRLADDPHGPHLRKVLDTIDTEAIAANRFRVLLDSNHGAGGILGRRLLEVLGCDVVAVGSRPDGQFAHVPEPTAANLADIAERVPREGCQIGFCQDPDADRLALIDENGRYVGEEYTLAVCVAAAMAQPATRGPVVINGATSGMSARIAADAGQTCFRSAVGEANVADKMIAEKATYGGEGNGGPIDPRVGYVRDSFVGMAQVLGRMAATGKSISQLCDKIPHLHIHKTTEQVDASELPKVFAALEAEFADAEADRGDGLRLQWKDAWLLVRGSNTEPIVRMIAEAPTAEKAKLLCETARELIGS